MGRYQHNEPDKIRQVGLQSFSVGAVATSVVPKVVASSSVDVDAREHWTGMKRLFAERRRIHVFNDIDLTLFWPMIH